MGVLGLVDREWREGDRDVERREGERDVERREGDWDHGHLLVVKHHDHLLAILDLLNLVLPLMSVYPFYDPVGAVAISRGVIFFMTDYSVRRSSEWEAEAFLLPPIHSVHVLHPLS